MDAEMPEPVLPTGRIEGPRAFADCVRQALACAASQGWRELILSDASFEDWPLHERAVVESLQAWSASGRRMTLVASRYDGVVRSQPRFVAWRQRWGHILDCRVNRRVDAADFPSAIWSPAWAMSRLDLARSTGVCSTEPDRRAKVREMLDGLLAGSGPGFPSSTLGL